MLVEMADERPRARQGCQFSLSKSCVALECLEGERRGETKTNLNGTHCLDDSATPLMNPEPR